jgi:hypothetical protein
MFCIVYPGQTVVGPFETYELAQDCAKAWGPNWRNIVQIWRMEKP